jgi:hypothetical protein
MCRHAAGADATHPPPVWTALPAPTCEYTRAGDCAEADRDGSVGHVPDRDWKAVDMQWSPRPGETVALVAVALGLGLALVVLDAPGRLLVGTGALLLLVLGARDAVARPRLVADAEGIVVRTLAGRQQLPWSGLRVRVRETRRLGMRSRTLELDSSAGPHDDGLLVVLGRRDLGTDPAEVARALHALDPSAS